MTETIKIATSIRIERPIDEVRAHYRDIDHHIRNNVHPGIQYQWEPGAPGERKIRTTFRILGIPQFDVSLLEDGEDGAFLIRYVEGTNAGMLLEHRFVRMGEGATVVQVIADAPATLGRKLLGPLFVAGGRQVMKKALIEDKHDLERAAFAPGKAAGDVERALEPARRLASCDVATKRAALEAACLVSIADGTVDTAERDAITRLATVLGANADGDKAFLDARLAELEGAAETERIASEADRVGAALKASNVGREGIVAAAVVSLVSQGMSLGELAVLRRIALTAGVAEETLGPIVDEADAALSAGAA